MATQVKICGLSTLETLDAALAAGADLVGLVFYPPSPRSVSLEQAARLARVARGRARIVALIVDASDNDLDAILADVDPDMLQLHGSETVARVAEIAGHARRPVMKAIKVATPADAALALDYSGTADFILFDAKPPAGEGLLPGGNGMAFDWRMLDAVKDKTPFVLSGGLEPGNVQDAIRQTGATIVDVSSGVERAPGIKSPELIRAFIDAAKTAGGDA